MGVRLLFSGFLWLWFRIGSHLLVCIACICAVCICSAVQYRWKVGRALCLPPVSRIKNPTNEPGNILLPLPAPPFSSPLFSLSSPFSSFPLSPVSPACPSSFLLFGQPVGLCGISTRKYLAHSSNRAIVISPHRLVMLVMHYSHASSGLAYREHGSLGNVSRA